MASTSLPDFQKGLSYWEGVEASVDGVLGGFGEGPLPRVEQLGSRLFLLSLLPQLQSFQSPLSSQPRPSLASSTSNSASSPICLPPTYRVTALDVGAGVGRVTAETLLPLCDDVVTVEPVRHFIEAGVKAASSGRWRHLAPRSRTRTAARDEDDEEEEEDGGQGGLGNQPGPRVWFIRAPLNELDPGRPLGAQRARKRGGAMPDTNAEFPTPSAMTNGHAPPTSISPQPASHLEAKYQTDPEGEEEPSGTVLEVQNLGVYGGTGSDATFGERMPTGVRMMYDVIWCQWCLGHLDDTALVAFLKRAKAALRHPAPNPSREVDVDPSEGEEPVPIHEMYPSVIVVKENMCEDGPGAMARAELDEEDSSLTRSNASWLEIFKQAGLTVVKQQVQEGLPAGLFAVKMFALR